MKKRLIALLCIVAWSLSALGLSDTYVLCIAQDGHIALERLSENCSGLLSPPSEQLVVSDNGAGSRLLVKDSDQSCLDVPIIFAAVSHQSPSPITSAEGQSMVPAFLQRDLAAQHFCTSTFWSVPPCLKPPLSSIRTLVLLI
jgi:hypothetical protein